jgi:hypothetical protein
MASSRIGRPPLFEDREMAWGSVEAADHAVIVALAEQMGLPRSRVVGALIMHGLKHVNEVQFPQGKQQQEELPLKHAPRVA